MAAPLSLGRQPGSRQAQFDKCRLGGSGLVVSPLSSLSEVSIRPAGASAHGTPDPQGVNKEQPARKAKIQNITRAPGTFCADMTET
jgi:hypothetical protein